MSRVTDVKYSRSERTLSLRFDDGFSGQLSAELLRVYSPSAEVRGHGGEQMPPVAGKANIQISTTAIRRVARAVS